MKSAIPKSGPSYPSALVGYGLTDEQKVLIIYNREQLANKTRPISYGVSNPASDSPDAKRVKFSPSQQEQEQEQSTFASFLTIDPNARYANSNVVRNQLLHCTKTPHPDKRRYRDVSTIVACALDRIAKEIFRNDKWSREDRTRKMKPHVEKYFGSNGGGGELC